MDIRFSSEPKGTTAYCSKCNQEVIYIKHNPNQWKPNSRNNDSHISACCGAKIYREVRK